VKYVDDLVLLAKEEIVLQDMTELIETGRCYGMEMWVEKTKSDDNLKATISIKTHDRPKTNGEYGIF
jgi:hypothetical protein